MKDGWSAGLLACPDSDCRGPLRPVGRARGGAATRTGVLVCRACGARYPVLGGVPILVSEPGRYLAGYREAVLATLAEHHALARDTVSLIDAFAAAHPDAEPLRFGDDWDVRERDPSAPRQACAGVGPAAAAFAAFLERAEMSGALATLLDLLGSAPADPVVEVGCGAGRLSAELAARVDRLVLADLSLRAVLVSRHRAVDAGRAAVVGVVADAESLPFAAGGVATLVAANVVDLLERPDGFFASAAHTLSRDGRLAVTTPDPHLTGAIGVGGAPDVLDAVAAAAGLRRKGGRAGVAWVRDLGPRHAEVYWVDAAIYAPGGRRRTRVTGPTVGR